MTRQRVQQERQQRRLRIQKAALALGPKATIEQIALEAFMTVGAVYLYFRSRDELIASLSELVQEDV